MAAIPLSELPHVLAGPILRRVEPHSVTVWIAMKEATDLQLHVYGVDSNQKTLKFSSNLESAFKIGANLFICCITATSEIIDNKLERVDPDTNETYYYDLDFHIGSNSPVSLDDNPGVDLLKKGNRGITMQELCYGP